MLSPAQLGKEILAILSFDLFEEDLDHDEEGTAFPQVRDFLSQGADPNVEDNDGRASLMLAAARGDVKICQLLLHHGANINPGCYNSSLSYAARYGRLEVCHFLLDRGSDLNGRGVDLKGSRRNASPLLQAVWRGDVDICKLFLSKGADVRCADKTPLCQLAAMKGHEAVCRLLLEHGVDINAGDPLAWAAMYGKLDVSRLLLEKGADLMQTDFMQRSCLFGAAEEGHLDVCALLLKHGANVDTRNSDGHTAFDCARNRGKARVAAMLAEVMIKKAAEKANRYRTKKLDALSMPRTPIYDSVIASIEKRTGTAAGSAPVAEKSDEESSDRDREKRELEMTVERLETEKSAAEVSLKEESRKRKRVEQESEATIARLEQVKATVDEKLELKSRELEQEKLLSAAKLEEERRGRVAKSGRSKS